MSQRRPARHYGTPSDPAAVAALAESVGIALLVAALPLAVGTFAGLVSSTPSLLAGFQVAAAAIDSPLTATGGLPWLFHLSTLGVLLGCWLLGAGLVLDGLYG